MRRAARDAERGLGRLELALDDDALAAIADGRRRRRAAARSACSRPPPPSTAAPARRASRWRSRPCARRRAGARCSTTATGEEHYNVVSAFIKSLRASDPDAALYWVARMLEAGEDPLFVARRLVIFASEDVGNADPRRLPLAIAAHQAVERIGMPEGRIPLAQAVTYLACAPEEQRRLRRAWNRASRAVESHGSLPVPLHLRNAPTALMQEPGYGRDYSTPTTRRTASSRRRTSPSRGRRDSTSRQRRRRGRFAERLARWRRRGATRAGGRTRPLIDTRPHRAAAQCCSSTRLRPFCFAR